MKNRQKEFSFRLMDTGCHACIPSTLGSVSTHSISSLASNDLLGSVVKLKENQGQKKKKELQGYSRKYFDPRQKKIIFILGRFRTFTPVFFFAFFSN